MDPWSHALARMTMARLSSSNHCRCRSMPPITHRRRTQLESEEAPDSKKLRLSPAVLQCPIDSHDCLNGQRELECGKDTIPGIRPQPSLILEDNPHQHERPVYTLELEQRFNIRLEQTRRLKNREDMQNEIVNAQPESQTTVEETQEKPVISKQEYEYMQIVLRKTKKKFHECLAHQREQSDISAGGAVSTQVSQQREANQYVSRKVLEIEVQCTQAVVESLKSQMSHSEAKLRRCRCKDEPSGRPVNTMEGDLIHTKMVIENYRRKIKASRGKTAP